VFGLSFLNFFRNISLSKQIKSTVQISSISAKQSLSPPDGVISLVEVH
jgi:hypothetical protein